MDKDDKLIPIIEYDPAIDSCCMIEKEDILSEIQKVNKAYCFDENKDKPLVEFLSKMFSEPGLLGLDWVDIKDCMANITEYQLVTAPKDLDGWDRIIVHKTVNLSKTPMTLDEVNAEMKKLAGEKPYLCQVHEGEEDSMQLLLVK
jgi:hypothetical protein